MPTAARRPTSSPSWSRAAGCTPTATTAITDRGAAAHDRLADVVDELRATLTEGLTDEEQAATAVALERMARNLGWSD